MIQPAHASRRDFLYSASLCFTQSRRQPVKCRTECARTVGFIQIVLIFLCQKYSPCSDRDFNVHATCSSPSAAVNCFETQTLLKEFRAFSVRVVRSTTPGATRASAHEGKTALCGSSKEDHFEEKNTSKSECTTNQVAFSVGVSLSFTAALIRGCTCGEWSLQSSLHLGSLLKSIGTCLWILKTSRSPSHETLGRLFASGVHLIFLILFEQLLFVIWQNSGHI